MDKVYFQDNSSLCHFRIGHERNIFSWHNRASVKTSGGAVITTGGTGTSTTMVTILVRTANRGSPPSTEGPHLQQRVPTFNRGSPPSTEGPHLQPVAWRMYQSQAWFFHTLNRSALALGSKSPPGWACLDNFPGKKGLGRAVETNTLTLVSELWKKIEE